MAAISTSLKPTTEKFFPISNFFSVAALIAPSTLASEAANIALNWGLVANNSNVLL